MLTGQRNTRQSTVTEFWLLAPPSLFCANILAVMAVNPELLKILVCPLCKAPVNLTESGQGLKCTQCRRVYPIRDDIPVMLISEAKVED